AAGTGIDRSRNQLKRRARDSAWDLRRRNRNLETGIRRIARRAKATGSCSLRELGASSTNFAGSTIERHRPYTRPAALEAGSLHRVKGRLQQKLVDREKPA